MPVMTTRNGGRTKVDGRMNRHSSRRDFLERAGWAGIGLGALGLAAALGRFLLPNVERDEPARSAAGRPQDLAPGQVAFLSANRTWLMRDSAGFYALSATCTHLGCTVRWDSDHFACPCHGSRYDSTGQVRQGPASRPLASVWVGLDAQGHLVVDRGRTVPATFRLVG